MTPADHAPGDHPAWAPAACTLPTAERPLRRAEFDELFTTALRAQHRVSATTLRWELDPAAEARARDLAARESGCCSFFTFTFHPGPQALRLDVSVPPARSDVLDGLADHAAARSAP
jgi:hypothetical protein